jgi:hypothetical protein
MALYYDLPVFKDVYSLTLLVFELTGRFAREYKFTLGQDMKRDCIILVRGIYRANKCKDRQTYLPPGAGSAYAGLEASVHACSFGTSPPACVCEAYTISRVCFYSIA